MEIVMDGEAWAEALAVVTAAGVTHRHYCDPGETDARLWQRVRDEYNGAIRRAGANCGLLPETPVGTLLADARRAYGKDAGRPWVDLERLAAALRAEYGTAHVGHSGGGCATLYVGPTYKDGNGDERWTLMIGPGWFDGPGFMQQGYASHDELYVGLDDDGQAETAEVPPGASDDELLSIAKTAHALATSVVAARAQLREVKRAAIQRDAAIASGRLHWVRQLSDAECETLQGTDAVAAGGEHDWRVAVMVYRVDTALACYDGSEVRPGTYVRLVEGKTVHGWQVEDLAAAEAYAAAVEAEYEHHMDNVQR